MKVGNGLMPGGIWHMETRRCSFFKLIVIFLRAVLGLQKTVQTVQRISIESFSSHSFFQLLIYHTSQ